MSADVENPKAEEEQKAAWYTGVLKQTYIYAVAVGYCIPALHQQVDRHEIPLSRGTNCITIRRKKNCLLKYYSSFASAMGVVDVMAVFIHHLWWKCATCATRLPVHVYGFQMGSSLLGISMAIDFVYNKHVVMTTWGLALYNTLEALLTLSAGIAYYGRA
ncbi:hypothetical protein POTOM_037548 [Populus tomentosa]|uniref:Uncharacterized protein n=1 Tax=Populus tomentosa TaxID=118781 RepID=A0A8X7YWZ7_POPTO|nr:hypothetical protein POTOM_037548 [Populus tomentosa]